MTAEQLDNVLKKNVAGLSRRPYILEKGPLVRFVLFHGHQNEDYFFFGIHQIRFDAWSCRVMVNELLHLYQVYASNRKPDLPELPIQYIDYALWQRQWLKDETLAVLFRLLEKHPIH